MKQRIANIRNNLRRSLLCSNLVLLFLGISSIPGSAGGQTNVPTSRPNLKKDRAIQYVRSFDFESLRFAINDLIETFGREYPKGGQYLERLAGLRKRSKTALDSFDRNNNSPKANLLPLADELEKLRYDSLLSNPLLDFNKLLLLKRKRGQLGLPVNHKCNTGIEQTGYDNEIAILEPMRPDGKLRTLYRPAAGEFVGETDLHYDAEKLLFTMPKGPAWQIFEIGTDGGGLRQVSRGEHPDVDNFDACYLPDDRIVFVSTASYTAVPCWHGKERACNIYLMAVYGGNILCDINFDDKSVATANVGSYKPNIWGLYDMHGNACEWTRTTYRPYPYKADDGRESLIDSGRKVVRGGSWCDRPKLCRSSFRLSYPAWQRVHNVGFRVVSEIANTKQKYTASASLLEHDETLRD